LLSRRALRALRQKMDPRTVNGGVFLGLNGLVVKSHGGSDEIAFKSALGLAYEMARSRLMDKVVEGMQRFPRNTAPDLPLAVPESQPEARPA
jgi:glycerol-3-phosphate acyltransferase PlsX